MGLELRNGNVKRAVGLNDSENSDSVARLDCVVFCR